MSRSPDDIFATKSQRHKLLSQFKSVNKLSTKEASQRIGVDRTELGHWVAQRDRKKTRIESALLAFRKDHPDTSKSFAAVVACRQIEIETDSAIRLFAARFPDDALTIERAVRLASARAQSDLFDAAASPGDPFASRVLRQLAVDVFCAGATMERAAVGLRVHATDLYAWIRARGKKNNQIEPILMGCLMSHREKLEGVPQMAVVRAEWRPPKKSY